MSAVVTPESNGGGDVTGENPVGGACLKLRGAALTRDWLVENVSVQPPGCFQVSLAPPHQAQPDQEAPTLSCQSCWSIKTDTHATFSCAVGAQRATWIK